MLQMTEEERIAFEWAKTQQFNSVSARYAKALAGYIKRNEEHEQALDAAHRHTIDRD